MPIQSQSTKQGDVCIDRCGGICNISLCIPHPCLTSIRTTIIFHCSQKSNLASKIFDEYQAVKEMEPPRAMARPAARVAPSQPKALATPSTSVPSNDTETTVVVEDAQGFVCFVCSL